MTSNRKQAFWQNHIRDWQASELNQQAYCREHELKPHQFTYWKNKFAQTDEALTPPDCGGFIPVQVLAPTKPGTLSIVLPNSIRLEGIAADNLSICRQIVEAFR